ncbi:MAG: hypothetical protein WAW03_10515 [Anaerolineae bacterium]|jgi:hypothetical protein|uniref:hypothetical protein n=1 Tax=Candidatus Amarolinea dominans TaxID=3140696 RepID=UPI00313553D3|nr:hypothetical protein [Anaerolineae bacterium]MBK9230040.1 hypothetical protein [Anaerolineae bacterium]
MPTLSRWLVRTSFLYLAAGFGLGDLILTAKGLGILPGIWVWLPAHVFLVLFGWIIQFTMGVAYWILPRWGVTEGRNRGNDTLPRLSYVNFNVGLLCLLLAPWLASAWSKPAAAWFNAVGGTLLVLAVALFLTHAWPRIKPFLT